MNRLICGLEKRLSDFGRDSEGHQKPLCRAVWLGVLLAASAVASSSPAAVVIIGTVPAEGQAVSSNINELTIDFSGPVDIGTATTDSIRLYRTGASGPAPGPGDTPIPIGNIVAENGDTRIRVSSVDPLVDGNYAIVVYGSASSRSGPGNDLHFTNNVATLSLAGFQTLGTNFTWEAWIHLECCTSYGGHGFGAIFDVGQNGRNVPGVILQHNQADWNFYCYRPDTTSSSATATGSVVLGTWQHIAGVSSSSGMKLYVNGELAASTADVCDISAMQSYFQTAISGYTRWAGAYDYILGSIDEMRVWNVTRTQAQIKSCMHTPLAGNEPGLLIYHPLDEGAGTALVDVTGHGYPGARGSSQWETSSAPIILMASSPLLGGDAAPVDADGDLLPGGVLVSPFSIDTTAPQVVDLTPALDVCSTILHPGSVAVQFNEDMNPATITLGNISLGRDGANGVIGDEDDIVVPFSFNYVQATHTLTVTPGMFADGSYRLVLTDALEDIAGISLDGEYPGVGGAASPLPSGDSTRGGPFVLEFNVAAEVDCNDNDVPDGCELDGNDLNGNGVPDECEDCNANGIVDECDVSCSGGGGACNIAGCGQSADCNGNLIPDECELTTFPTNLPAGYAQNPVNLHYYFLTPTAMTWPDAEAYAQSFGGHLATIRNADENNWLVSVFSAQASAGVHIGFNDIATEGTWGWVSGEPVTYTNWASGEPNNAGNEDWGALSVTTSGGLLAGQWNDAKLNVRGIVELIIEPTDCNENGVLDECDIASGASGDCDENGVPDECQPGGSYDCDGDGTPEICEPGGFLDCNGDGIPDACEIADGAPDCNSNGVPDECELHTVGTSLDFSNDYVRVPPSTSLRPAQELTIEAWVRPEGDGANNNRIIRDAGSKGYILAAGQSQTGARFQLRIDGAAGGSRVVVDPAALSDYFNTWHHVAGVYSVSGNYARIYVDGVLKAEGTSVGTLNYNGTYFYIGNQGSSEAFDGQIDEVRIWNLARTAAEIIADKDSELGGNEPGLMGYWRFNEGSGQIANDSSPNGNVGQLGNASVPDEFDPIWYAGSPSLVIHDCNENGVLDECDIASGAGGDCDGNGIPDECQPGGSYDCDGDGTPEICEPGGFQDCDGDGIPDACEIADGAPDCNSNGVPDACEPDCNDNGIADSCDIGNGTSPDCNMNGVPDACDISVGTSADANSNSVPDDCEPDIRIEPVITLVDPMAGSEVRGSLPTSIDAVTRGGYYYVEIWASDVGSTNTGLTGAYADIHFCSSTSAQEVGHGSLYTLFPGGTIQAGAVDEFGGSSLPGGYGGEPAWVRLGWVKMLGTIEAEDCAITLSPGSGGVAAFGRGTIPNSLVALGSASVTFVAPVRSYDLDNSGVIDVGDLSLFATSWLQPVPPAQESHDFDCNEFVGVSDLSWFATGWQKIVDNPSILYPLCDFEGRGAPTTDTDVEIQLVVRSSTSGGDLAVTLPASMGSISSGQLFFVEIWASDIGDINTGLTSAYLNLSFPPDAAVVSIQHHGVFNVLPSGSPVGDTINSLGGSNLNPENGVTPLWVRVASVKMLATADRPVFRFDVQPSPTGVASYGRGAVPWSQVNLEGQSVGTPEIGDIDGDGDVDMTDAELFVPVLLGDDVDPGHTSRADLNQDSIADGADVQGFVEVLLGSN